MVLATVIARWPISSKMMILTTTTPTTTAIAMTTSVKTKKQMRKVQRSHFMSTLVVMCVSILLRTHHAAEAFTTALPSITPHGTLPSFEAVTSLASTNGVYQSRARVQPSHPARGSSSTRLYWHSSVSRQKNGIDALNELFEDLETPDDEMDEQGLVFLFVGQAHVAEFRAIAQLADSKVESENTHVIAVVGGGVIGGGKEFDDPFGPPVMTMLAGILPSSARAIPFSMESDDALPSWTSEWLKQKEYVHTTSKGIISTATSTASHILFVDPWCAHTEDLLRLLSTSGAHRENEDRVGADSHASAGEVVIGGISFPSMTQDQSTLPTISINGRVLPHGSAAGMSLIGTVGIQSIVAQGCRPIGPTYTITSAANNILTSLDGKPAYEQLQGLISEMSLEEQQLMEQGGILCGIEPSPEMPSQSYDDADDAGSGRRSSSQSPQDYLIRMIVGFVPSGAAKGSILIGVHELRNGDSFQFHIRDAPAAMDDMRVMVQRTKTERLFAGADVAGVPLAALQISCVGRGKSLFQQPDVDLEQVNQLLGVGMGSAKSDTGAETSRNVASGSNANDGVKVMNPVAGFFANGEIGPVGVSKLSNKGGSAADASIDGRAHIHGFTTVVALLCDFSSRVEAQQKQKQNESKDNDKNKDESGTATQLPSGAAMRTEGDESEPDAWG